MTPATPPTEARVRRSRNAAASRADLLAAAQELFGQRGFDGTTIRDIGEAAGVDAALIARYFGSKADLYIAAVVAEARDEAQPDHYERVEDMARALFTRTDTTGLGPVTQALIRADTTEEIRAAARGHLGRRTVEPLRADLARQGVDRPQLRAEVLVAALMGVNLGRALGWFDELADVERQQLVDLVADLLDGPNRPEADRP